MNTFEVNACGFKFIIINIPALFGKNPFQQQNEHTYMILPEAGHGQINRVTTYSGIEIVYSNIQYHEPYPTSFAFNGQMIELQFALSGQRHVDVAGLDYTLPKGQGALIFLQDFKAWFYPPFNEQYTSFALGIPVSLFNYAASQLVAHRKLVIDFNQILKGAYLIILVSIWIIEL